MNHKPYLYRVLHRCTPYLYHVHSEVRKRHMPGELSLLPVIESAYNPFASSPAGASGLWQLMPRTAWGYGVKHSRWYDGRRDVLNSTRAALTYLAYLHRFFNGNWLHAVGAYDVGEGNLLYAIRRNAREGYGTEFWDLRLPMETRTYVPRLIAVACIIENPRYYGITLPHIRNRPYFQTVEVHRPIDLPHAARLAGISIAEMRQLNPAIARYATDPEGPHSLLVPKTHAALFQHRLAQLPKTQFAAAPATSPEVSTVIATAWHYHRVVHGESLAKIARRYRTSSTLLRQANHMANNKLAIGKLLRIPHWHKTPNEQEKAGSTSLASLSAPSKPARIPETRERTQPALSRTVYQNGSQNRSQPVSIAAGPSRTHTVKSGDTLYSLAQKYHVDPKALKTLNGLKSDRLALKQTLKLPEEKNKKPHRYAARGAGRSKMVTG